MQRQVALALVLTLVASGAWAVGRGKVKYMGGTIDMQEKKEAPFEFTDEGLRISPKKNEGSLTVIPWDQIESIEYGQEAGRRVKTAIFLSPLALFGKARKHYVTLSWGTNAAVFEFDKKDIRMALAVLESKTSLEFSCTDEESRKQYCHDQIQVASE